MHEVYYKNLEKRIATFYFKFIKKNNKPKKNTLLCKFQKLLL